MKFYSRALRAVPLIAYVIAAASTVFQTLAYASSYEAPKANYFSNGAPFSTIATIFTAIGLIAGIALVFLLPKKEAPDDALPVPLASISASIGFAAGAIALLLSAETRLARVATVFLLLAAVYSALVAFAKKLDDGIKALVGFGTIIGCVLLAADRKSVV